MTREAAQIIAIIVGSGLFTWFLIMSVLVVRVYLLNNSQQARCSYRLPAATRRRAEIALYGHPRISGVTTTRALRHALQAGCRVVTDAEADMIVGLIEDRPDDATAA